ncbi:MAG TPA: LamG-like jellyroll fold domain-containing protein [Saprospiraceae bacterium]|nr:LamG-like jellyroll fold domain-containing protein [Saprospiraceae bacterium]
MKTNHLLVACLLFPAFIHSTLVSAQDTITVQTFSWDNPARRGVFQFPENPNETYRKILMQYNMRCHGARVGVGNVGCYEWDYSCNTFLTDSSRLDSNLASIGSYVISGFNGFTFYYTTQPTYSYYRLIQKDASYTSVVSEQKRTLGNGNLLSSFSSPSGRFRAQYLFTVQELQAAGLTPGSVTGLDLDVAKAGDPLSHFRIRMKAVSQTEFPWDNPEVDGLTEVYYKDSPFPSTGQKRLHFYTPFQWDGTRSVLIEISYTDLKAVNFPEFRFHDAGADHRAIHAQNPESSFVSDGVTTAIQGGKLDSIQNEITVSFWAYGTTHLQPSNGSILEGQNRQGQRAFNIHLPWGNGGVYFDCGFENGGYDRIEKAGMTADYEGQWNHWAFTRNANTGEMKIFLNGRLWQSGLARLKPIQLSVLKIGEAFGNTGTYYGRIRELGIWNKALDSTRINQWKNRSLDASHPEYDHLIYYFDLQDADPIRFTDQSPQPQSLVLPASYLRHQERGDQLVLDYVASRNRPNIQLIQGIYSGSKVSDIPVLDSVPNGPRKVTQYRVEHQDLFLDSVFYVYAAADDQIRFENGSVAENIFIDPEDLLDIQALKYFVKTPAKYELLSLVTPYGNNLDLGKDGKTFVFDVSDFAPILQGRKVLSMELGGENQEEIDLKFIFIKGTPERKVIDISNIWPFQRGSFADILTHKKFELRSMLLHPDAESYKLRFSVTGHEQNGEFTSRKHFVNVQGKTNKSFPFTVWKECAWNPIYPQGGTWIFDRAGWCPGAPTDVHQFDLTGLASAGDRINLDYGLEPPQMDQANYLVSSQLVAYGPMVHALDASLEEIKRPSSGRVEFDRLNPSCNRPLITVRNSGRETITSLEIAFQTRNGIREMFHWTGNLPSAQNADIELPVNSVGFWNPGPDSIYVFDVELISINGRKDDVADNDRKSSPYKPVDRYAVNLFFEFKTNNNPQDNDYKIVNSQGQVVLERSNMAANQAYRDELLLPPGCYTLQVNDASHDGLYFWFYPGNGNGTARMMRKINNVVLPIRIFNPDFGAGFQYDFFIPELVANEDVEAPVLLSISPNPVRDEVRIEFGSTKTGPVEWSLFHADGQRIHRQESLLLSGKTSVQWKLGELPAGSYVVRIVHGGKTYSRKLVKI